MLDFLRFHNVGPSPSLGIQFNPRLNVLTGDNGLGKSFLLDAAWWALTRTWARRPLMPHPAPSSAKLEYAFSTQGGKPIERVGRFNRQEDEWQIPPGRPPIPGLVIYAQVDGGFAVWDPERNYSKKEDPDRPASYRFSAQEVWDGLPLDSPDKLCNGLIADWGHWQLEDGEAFRQLTSVLRALSPNPSERLEAGKLLKVSLNDARRHPTLRMPYGRDVPLIHASAGMRRIVALAYLLVWTWQEHLAACTLKGKQPAKEIIFLVDEIEAHLHPRWQRRIVPALLGVMDELTGHDEVPMQLIAATHSPLVTASLEPHFDSERDAIWESDLVDGAVELQRSAWYRRGDANAWLTSSVFDLKQARSLEAEHALTRAHDLLREPEPDSRDIEQVDALLQACLGDTDRFWVRWSAWRDERNGVS